MGVRPRGPAVLDAYRREGLSAGGRPAMPELVADLLARCFQERPEDRPRDLVEVVSGLRAAWEQVAGRPYPRREPRGGRGSADALSNRAVSLVDLGRAAEAATLWRRALEAEAQHVEATYNAGLAAWVEGRMTDPELLHRLEESCASHATSSRAAQLLGRVHLALGQGPEALAELERAAALGRTEELDRDVAAARVGAPPPLRTVRGLQGPVAALALSPDGRTVAAGSGAEVRLWDAATGQLVRTLSVPDGPVRSLALLPDGRFLVMGVENGPLAVWDLGSGRQARAWTRHAGFATSLAVVPGGRLVASGGSDRVVRLWDPASGRIVHEMAGHEDAVTAVAVGAKHLASASRDGTVRVWALEDGRCLGTLRGHQGRVLAVALDEAQARLVSAGEDATVRDWGLHSRETVRVYRSHGQPVLAVALSADGGRIVSGSADRTVRAFEAAGERLSSFARLDGAVHALALAPEGTCWAGHGAMVSALPAHRLHLPAAALCRPASASEEEARASSVEARLEDARRSLAAGDLPTAVSLARRARTVPGHERSEATLAVWDDLCARLPRQALQSAWEDARLEGHEDQVLAVAVDEAGSRALTAGLDATVRLWDLTSRRHEATLSGHDGAVTSVAFAGAGRAVSGGRDRTVRLWDVAGRRALAVLEGHEETVTAVDATADGLRAASASWDGTVRLWDLRRRVALRVLEGHGAHVAAVRLAPDGQVVASAGWDGTARLWDAESGRELGVLAGHDGNVTAIALHADGRQVATGGEDGTVRAWDARTRRAERVLAGHEGEITGLAFTPDGRFLLSGSRDHTVRVWDLRRGEAVRTLPHPALVLGLALTPVASALVTACADRCARVWHLDWEPEIPVSPPAATPTARIGGETVRTRVAATVFDRHGHHLREDLRRAAPIGIPALPRAARAARRIPWRRVAIVLGLLATIVVASLAWRRPAAGLRVSPHMAQAVPREIDLIDLEPYREDCSPGDYERHLEEMRSGKPDARDVACLAARGTAGVVGDVLDGAPLAVSRCLDGPAPAPQRGLGPRRAAGGGGRGPLRPPRRRARRGPPRRGDGPRRDGRRRHGLRPPGAVGRLPGGAGGRRRRPAPAGRARPVPGGRGLDPHEGAPRQPRPGGPHRRPPRGSRLHRRRGRAGRPPAPGGRRPRRGRVRAGSRGHPRARSQDRRGPRRRRLVVPELFTRSDRPSSWTVRSSSAPQPMHSVRFGTAPSRSPGGRFDGPDGSFTRKTARPRERPERPRSPGPSIGSIGLCHLTPRPRVGQTRAVMTPSRLPSRFLPSLLFAALLGGSLVSPGPALAQELPDWENPQVVGINKLDPHAPVYPFADPATARALDRTKSPFYRLLNGRWKFKFSAHPGVRPLRFFETGFDDAAWDTIPVPANIEKHGYAPPVYVNIGYAWGWNTPPPVPQQLDHVGGFRATLGDAPGASAPPFVPHDLNYVGSYRHPFEVPASWQGRRVRITFQGVSAGFYLWVNGKKIGYSEDSRGPAEFDITDAVKPGQNLLAVEVYRFTDGAYLECQDFWRLSGIFRDVVLWSTEALHVEDFRVITDLDAQYKRRHPRAVRVGRQRDRRRAGLRGRGLAPRRVGPGRLPRPHEGRSGPRRQGRHRLPGDPGPEPAEVVRREAEPLHAPSHLEGRRGPEPRGRALACRLPRGRDEGREDPRQRPAHPHPGRQPARVGPAAPLRTSGATPC